MKYDIFISFEMFGFPPAFSYTFISGVYFRPYKGTLFYSGFACGHMVEFRKFRVWQVGINNVLLEQITRLLGSARPRARAVVISFYHVDVNHEAPVEGGGEKQWHMPRMYHNMMQSYSCMHCCDLTCRGFHWLYVIFCGLLVYSAWCMVIKVRVK